MKAKSLAHNTLAAALLIPTFLSSFLAQPSKAEWLKSLPPGGEAWATYSLSKGDYIIEASTLWSLGDVDIAVYDSSNRLIGQSQKLGSDRIRLSVGYRDTFYLKYMMPICANPIGDCAVNIKVFGI